MKVGESSRKNEKMRSEGHDEQKRGEGRGATLQQCLRIKNRRW